MHPHITIHQNLMFKFHRMPVKVNEVSCYVCHEGQGQRGVANEIGACVWHYLNGINTASAENN